MLPKESPISPKAIAAWFVNHADANAGDTITHLKVQKLVYYADAWFLANFDRCLIVEEFEAWAHGPVSPTLWKKYKGAGWDTLNPEKMAGIPKTLERFLFAVYDKYGQFSAKKLEQITHSEDPWKITRGTLPPEAGCDNKISKLLTRNYYAKRLGKKELQSLSH